MPRTVTGAIDPKDIFENAVAFDYTARLLQYDLIKRLHYEYQSHNDGSGNFINICPPPPELKPALVNCALAIELYLKCILLIETGNTYIGHDLSTFYSMISSSMRNRIESIYNQAFSTYPAYVSERDNSPDKTQFELVSVFQSNDSTFMDVRYSYEPKPLWAGKLPDLAKFALARAILELKPEWAPLSDCLGRLPKIQYLPMPVQPFSPGFPWPEDSQ
jgi:hypothetical protein